MTRISEQAAAQFLDYQRNLVDLVLIHIADDWLLMTRSEADRFLDTQGTEKGKGS